MLNKDWQGELTLQVRLDQLQGKWEHIFNGKIPVPPYT